MTDEPVDPVEQRDQMIRRALDIAEQSLAAQVADQRRTTQSLMKADVRASRVEAAMHELIELASLPPLEPIAGQPTLVLVSPPFGVVGVAQPARGVNIAVATHSPEAVARWGRMIELAKLVGYGPVLASGTASEIPVPYIDPIELRNGVIWSGVLTAAVSLMPAAPVKER